MKKTFIIIVAMAFASLHVQAQVDPEVEHDKVPNYHYNWFDSVWDQPIIHDSVKGYPARWSPIIRIQDTLPINYHLGRLKGYFAETAVAYIPDSVMHLVGVAFGSFDSTCPSSMYSYDFENLLPERYHDIAVYHVNIYDKQMNLLQTVSVPYTDGLQFARNISIGVEIRNVCQYTICYSIVKHVYLNTPMDMTDTFYISRVITYNDTVWPYCDISFRQEDFCSLKNTGLNNNDSVTFYLPWEYYKFRSPQSWEHRDTSQWRDDYTFGWQHALMYPIVENPGDSCPQVRGVEVMRSGATQAFLTWQSGTNHHDWQLAYGPAGTPPEDCTVLDYNRTMSDLLTLDPDSHYVAYVRARCRLARDEWGPWSDPTVIWLNDPTGIDGVALPEVTLTPNPTRGTVTVASSAQLLRIEVYDPQGRLLRTVAADGTAATLDLTALPPAVYTLIIHTAAGTQTRKLTVTR